MISSAATRAPMLTLILTQAGVVTDEQVNQAIARQRETGLRSGELLVQMGAATEEDIGWALARQLDLTFIDPRPETLDNDLIQTFPEELLRRIDALPLMTEDDFLAVALADPTDRDGIAELTKAAGRPLRIAVATPSAIRRALRDVFGVPPHHDRPDGEPVATTPGSDDAQHRAGAVFLLERLREARAARAAEIHLVPATEQLEVWHRVAGKLVVAEPRSLDALTGVLSWIRALGGPSLEADARHAWGRVTCPEGPKDTEIAVSLLRQPPGVCVSIELLAPPAEQALDWLGLDAVDLARLREALAAPSGLGLIVGPPSCGGSTMLEAMAVECEHTARRCVRWNAGWSFDGRHRDTTPQGVSAALLHGADVVALDDVPAGALAATLSPAGSGLLVLARAIAVDSFALLEQLAASPLDRAALAGRLRFVVQQRRAWLADAAASSGSSRCTVFEVLLVDDGLREALRAGERADVLRARAAAAGFVPLQRRLQVLVSAGLVSGVEAARLIA